MAGKFDIQLHGAAVNLVKRCGRATLSDVLQSKFGCVATIVGVDFEEDPSIAQQKRPSVAPEKRDAFELRSGVQVSVWKADLTNFPVEAVVNAANEHLQHCGGLALALSKAGGPQIQKDSGDYIYKHGSLNPGDAIVTDAGLLTNKKIIHAVGPQLPKYASTHDVAQARPLLEKVIRSVLDKVKEEKLMTVAIPAISSGLFNYPLPQCADTIVRAVKQYYEKPQRHLPKEILLVNHDDPTVNEMEKACRQILTDMTRQTRPEQTMAYSHAAGSKGRGDGKASAPTVQIGNVRLTLKRGNIEEQQTDVIVNTTYSRYLNNGEISKAILQKAGYGLQKEMDHAHMTGSIVITDHYNLHCKEVYHTFCSGNVRGTPHQIIFNSVLECLRLAAKDHKSVAFPAIGTGGLQFDKKEVAQSMSEAVADFTRQHNKKMEVYFVIFPSDNSTFKAFEEQMRSLQKKAPHPSFLPASEHRDDFHGSRAPTPHISLNGPSDAAIHEAKQWLSGLLFQSSDTVVIYNNFILHFGHQEHLQLCGLMKKGVSIEEVFEEGRAGIIVKGGSVEDVVVAGLLVEAILCDIQREFVKEEKSDISILLMSTEDVSFERKTVDYSRPEFSRRVSAFKERGLQMLKMDEVKNSTLELLFGLKRNQLHCSPPQRMFQLIPVQFCEMVSHIGFHAEYAPPEDPAYGEGIYFAKTVKRAMEVWRQPNKRYLHFVEADVLTGNSIRGERGLILPPAVGGTEPHSLYDSVDGRDVSVIFSGYQALPRYIITCEMY